MHGLKTLMKPMVQVSSFTMYFATEKAFQSPNELWQALCFFNLSLKALLAPMLGVQFQITYVRSVHDTYCMGSHEN